MFAPLHVKSEYSLGIGTAPVEALVERAAAVGWPAMALTDLETLAGQVRFHHAARRFGIQAITGVELRTGTGPHALGARAGRLIALARDRAGYENLCRIVSDRHAGRVPAADDPVLDVELHRNGLFFLSDDGGVLARLAARGVAPAQLRWLAAPGAAGGPPGIDAIADPDVAMLEAADRDLHGLLGAIRERRRWEPGADTGAPERAMPAPSDLRAWFGDRPEALAATLRLAAACTLDLSRTTPHVPALALPAGESAYAALVRRAREGLKQHPLACGRPRAEYERRLDHELERVARRDLAGYLLVVAEVAGHAREAGIELLARGSAVGSLIVHLLGISPIDPLEHDLLFERFLPAGRADLPDVDLDVPADRRAALIEWVIRRFGPERVARVATHPTFRRRTAWREGLRALGLAPAEIAGILDHFPAVEIEADVEPPPVDRLPPRLRPYVPLLERLAGRPHHLSVHPGGLVIADPAVELHAPLERAPGGAIVTQYDMTALAKLGLVKLDLLGNRALSAVETAERWLGRACSGSGPGLEPGADAATLATLRSADTLGCFQIESPAMRSVLRRFPVGSLDDLVAALAIVRPGPASGAAKEAFLRRARGEEPVTAPHPDLATLLGPTRGLFLFEEDLVRAIAALTSRTLDQADELRVRLVEAGDDLAARARVEEILASEIAARGHGPATTTRVVRELSRFAAYSFSRAHATSRARLAWRCARLKSHHPRELACGVLDHYGGQYPLRAIAADFARHGVTLLPPDVGRSAPGCTLEADGVRIGLAAIQPLTAATRTRILELRPFRDLLDFLEHVRPSAAELEAMVLGGACDGLRPLAPEHYPFAHESLLARLGSMDARPAVMGLEVPAPPSERAGIYRRLVRAFQEVRFLGMHPSGHPMAVLREEARRSGCVDRSELADRVGDTVRFAGIVSASRRLVTAGGHVMQFVTVEDEHGTLETVVVPGVYAGLGDPIRAPGPWLLTGRVESDRGDLHLVISEALPFHLRDAGETAGALRASGEEDAS